MPSSTIIKIPSDDKAFEENCLPLFCGILNDPNVKLVGTRGKSQSGIDLTGRRDRDPTQPVGIQCKLITRGGKLTEEIVRADLDKALKITPALTEFIVVTTASDDLEYDRIANTLSQEQMKRGRQIDVQVWGWDTLQPKIRAYKAALDAFDPGHSASTDRLVALGEESIERHGQTKAAVDRSFEVQERILKTVTAIDAGRSGKLDAHFDIQIDGYRDILNDGKPQTALELLEKLEAKLTPDDSAAIRARVRANIGLAYQRLGNDERAGELLLEAYELNPDDTKVATNRALGLQLLGRFEESADWARARLLEDPTDEHAAAFLLQAATFVEDLNDPMADIPGELSNRELVRIYRCAFLRSRERDDEWRQLAIENWQDNPDSLPAGRLAGDAYLEIAIGDGRFERSAKIEPARHEALTSARDLLQTYWDEVRRYENADQNTYNCVACNLITAYRALGQPEQADTIAAQLLAISPSDENALMNAAYAAMDQGQHEHALVHARKLENGPAKTALLLHIWSAQSDWESILGYKSEERRTALSEAVQEQYDAMVFRATYAADTSLDCHKDADTLLERWPNSLPIHVTIADALSHHGSDRLDDVIDRAKRLLTVATNFGHRSMLANLFYLEERWDDVVETLTGFVATDRDTVQLSWLALSHANSDERTRASAFFRELSPELLAISKYARLAGAAEHNRGDVKAAERYLRSAIDDDPNDLRAHLLLQSALQRANKSKEAREHILPLDETKLLGNPHDCLRLAMLLRHFGEAGRALELGFEVASQNRGEREIVASYPGLIFTDEKLPSSISLANGLGANFWFRLEGLHGEEPVEGILSDEEIPEVQNFPSDHALAGALAGKAVGDRVTLPQNMGPDLVYEIKEVKHKYIWLLHDIMHTHGARFPEETAMFSLKTKKGDVQPILDMAKEMSERGRSIIDVYLENAIPLAAVAPMCRKNIIEMADNLVIIGEDLRTCLGAHDERSIAQQVVVEGRGQGAALDTIAVWRASQLGVLQNLRAWFGTLYVAQSTFDELLDLRSSSEFASRRDTGFLGYHEGEHFRSELTAEEASAQKARIDRALDEIQRCCEVVPVDDSQSIEGGWKSALAENSLLLDPILVARERDCLLLSEELNTRPLAHQLGVARSSWLQVTLMTMSESGEIETHKYCRATARLAASRHGYISLSGDALLGILQLDDPLAFEYFSVASRYIGGPKAEPISHIEAVKGFALSIESAPLPEWQKGRAFGLMIERLIANRLDWHPILFLLELQLRALRGNLHSATWAHNYLIAWLRGHFIDIDKVREDPRLTNREKKRAAKSRKKRYLK
jgi:tetratricopeptide (TPR) repeat protein